MSKRVTFRSYTATDWDLRNELASTTKGMYQRILAKHVTPALGRKVLSEITTADVQAALRAMKDKGASPFLIYQCKAAMSHVFRTAVEEGLMEYNVASRVRTPKRETALRKVLEPEDVKAVMAVLTPEQALLVRVLIDSGIRFGEATELRPHDVDLKTGVVIVRRSVADVGKCFHPEGSARFEVKKPKSGRERVTSVSKTTAQMLAKHVRKYRLKADDLLFAKDIVVPPTTRVLLARGDIERPQPTSERTEPNERGFTYLHGTLIAYTQGRCRCAVCYQAMSDYSRQHRAKKKAKTPRYINTTGHLARDIWGPVWRKAVAEAGIGWAARTHDLRHANATWLLKNGMDIHTVAGRLGHHSITVTEGYLHRMKGEDPKAAQIIEGLIA